MVKKNICGLTYNEILKLIEPYGFSIRHALAISNGIYKYGITDFSLIDGIPKNLKTRLEAETVITPLLKLGSERSSDKSVKYLFRSDNGLEFESVFIPDNKRTTVCVSTQSGCRMGCKFCATGKYGFRGNLSAGDIVNQVVLLNSGRVVNHVVFMGMGEPMDNFENVMKASEILTSEWGLSIGSRNITVSTVGITPFVERFLNESDCNLTLSLHSPFSEEREKVIPAEKMFPAKDTVRIMKNYPIFNKRRFSIAYVMISGLNDSDLHLNGLKALLKDSRIRVNLLPYHQLPGDEYITSMPERMQYFKHSLITSGISASVRKSRGEDISAACGLLTAGKGIK
jgi:23S rRNA (adenine2503-C2)-methyltransferase